MKVSDVARVAHEVNRATCAFLGDPVQEPWEQAPQWQRESCEAGVKAHLTQDLTPEQAHELWMDHKRADGWCWGGVKNPERKTHPCLVPYELLPEGQKLKDSQFIAVVHSLRELVDE